MKKLLITGASGFIGGVAAYMARTDYEVAGTYFTRPFTLPGVNPVKLDVTDRAAVKKFINRYKPDAIILCAAQANLDRCEEDQSTAEKINISAVEYISESAKNVGSKVVFTSSDMVYDGKKGYYKETDSTNPINFYGITKRRAEKIILTMLPDSIVVRVALVYGKPITSASSYTEKLINNLKMRLKVKLFKDQFRTPIHVRDLAKGLIELADKDFSGIINLGGNQRIDRYSLGVMLADILNLNKDMIVPCLMKDVFQRAPRPVDTSLDISLAKIILKTNFEGVSSGLKKAYEF